MALREGLADGKNNFSVKLYRWIKIDTYQVHAVEETTLEKKDKLAHARV